MEFPQVPQRARLKRLRLGVPKYACRQVVLGLVIAGLLASMAVCVSVLAESHKPAQITALTINLVQNKIEVRIQADRELAIRSTILTNPDRIVLDIAGARFKIDKPEIPAGAGPLKSVRIALFAEKPPTTRIVVETSAPLEYRVRPETNSAVLEISLPSAPQASVVTAEKPSTPPSVTYNRGMLTIEAENSSLAEILNAVHSQIGGVTDFPAAAARERATVKLGPGPLVKVLASLLQGSPFDYVILGSGQENGGIQIVLSEKRSLPEARGEPVDPVALAAPRESALANGGATNAALAAPLNSSQPSSNSSQPAVSEPVASQSIMNQSMLGGSMGSQPMPGTAAGAMANGEAAPPGDSAGLDTQGQFVQDEDGQSHPVKPSREGPRIPPAGKGH
jgi:AMIN domain